MNTKSLPAEFLTKQESDRIALRGVRLSATVSALSLKATLEQTFVNQEPHAVEAIYTFPLPETAAVCAFEVRTGDHVLTGKVETADEALQQYDEAIADGNAAYLLEQDRPDVVTVRVGNLKPKQAATIGISYSAPLERVDRSLRIRIPTVIAPRYISSAGSHDPLQTAIDGDALNPPHAHHVPYGVAMDLAVRLGYEVRAISSPTHTITVEPPLPDTVGDAAGVWHVRFSGGLAQMDRDVVIEIALRAEPQPVVHVAAGPDEARYLAVTFVPELDLAADDPSRNSETVFLLDCSGSMQGESIAQAQAALELCLRSMSPGDTFNVCRFGSSFQLLAPRPVVYADGSLAEAIRFVRQGADLGGTEIHAPLEAILQAAPQQGTVRNVVVLTDGQVSNEPHVVELARKHRSTNRLFTFGIGSAASGYLVTNLAKATGGAAEFISGNERIEDKVLRTFSRIGSPAVSNVALTWGRGDLQTVGELPALFDGDVLQTFARAPGRLPESITLACSTPTGPRSWTLAVPQQPTHDDNVIATAWARAMIEQLENEATGQTKNRQRRESSGSRRLVTLSKQFNLLSSKTSFIALEHRTLDERNAGMPELRRVPVKLAAGWGGAMMLSDASANMAFCFAAPASGAAAAAPAGGDGMLMRMAKKLAGSLPGIPKSVSPTTIERHRHRLRESMRGQPRESVEEQLQQTIDSTAAFAAMESPDGEGDVLLRLLALQSADGWFADEYFDVLAATGHDVKKFADEIAVVRQPTLPADPLLSRRILATATVVAALKSWFTDRRDLWLRAEAKALRWLLANARG